MPRSSAAAITSSSRIAAAGLDHRGGAGVDDARRGRRGTGRRRRRPPPSPASDRPALLGLDRRRCARESTRLICPAPTPSVMPSRAEDDGVGLDELGDRQANSRSCSCCGVGCFLRHDLAARRRRRSRSSAVCTSRPAADALEVVARCAGAVGASGTSSTRTFCLAGEHRARLGVIRGRDQHFDELLARPPRRRRRRARG